jgi:hypothetical protein
MMNHKKPDLRDQSPKGHRHVTPTDTEVKKFAGDESPDIAPSTGRLVTPDPGNVPEGQATKG